MLRRLEQRVDQSFALIVREERLGQPGRLVGVPDSARLSEVAAQKIYPRARRDGRPR